MANHRGRLEEALVCGRQPVDTGREHRLHGGWHLQGLEGLSETVGSQRTHEYPGLYQRLFGCLCRASLI